MRTRAFWNKEAPSCFCGLQALDRERRALEFALTDRELTRKRREIEEVCAGIARKQLQGGEGDAGCAYADA